MAKPRIQARVSEETQQRIEDLAESKGADKSAIIRRALQTGLDDMEQGTDDWVKATATTTAGLYLVVTLSSDGLGLPWAIFGVFVTLFFTYAIYQPELQ
jgi:predicted transcriptional regulator